MPEQQYCLRWNNHHPNYVSVFSTLLYNELLVDVTLIADGAEIHAHKLILSACSTYFQRIFIKHQCRHPIVILKDVEAEYLKIIIDFIYHGEVNCTQDQLPEVLKIADMLQVKGLTEVSLMKHTGSSGNVSKDDGHSEQNECEETAQPIRTGPKKKLKTVSFQTNDPLSSDTLSEDVIGTVESNTDTMYQDNTNDSIDEESQYTESAVIHDQMQTLVVTTVDENEVEANQNSNIPSLITACENTHKNEIVASTSDFICPSNNMTINLDPNAYASSDDTLNQTDEVNNDREEIEQQQPEQQQQLQQEHKEEQPQQQLLEQLEQQQEQERLKQQQESSTNSSDLIAARNFLSKHLGLGYTFNSLQPTVPTVKLNFLQADPLTPRTCRKKKSKQAIRPFKEHGRNSVSSDPFPSDELGESHALQFAKKRRLGSNIDNAMLGQAIEAVRQGMGFLRASRIFGVNNRTLWLEFQKRGYPSGRNRIKSSKSIDDLAEQKSDE